MSSLPLSEPNNNTSPPIDETKSVNAKAFSVNVLLSTATIAAYFNQGQDYLEDRQYEDAIVVFSSLTEECETRFGSESIEYALALFYYGNALLTKEQDIPEDPIMTNTDAPPPDIDVDEESGQVNSSFNGDDDNNGNSNGDDDNNQISEDMQDEANDVEGDLQLAWEVLEVARKILAEVNDQSYTYYIIEIYAKLGDINTYKNDYLGAIEEYEKAISLSKSLDASDSGDKLLSACYYSLAVAHIYNAKEDGSDLLAETKKALQNYNNAREIIQMWLSKPGNQPSKSGIASTSSSSEMELNRLEKAYSDKKLLLDELSETIATLTDEIANLIPSSSSSSSATTTTIGFGSSAFTADVNPSLFSFTSATATSSGPSLLVKKKVKSESVITTADGNVSSSIIASTESNHSTNKRKHEDESNDNKL